MNKDEFEVSKQHVQMAFKAINSLQDYFRYSHSDVMHLFNENSELKEIINKQQKEIDALKSELIKTYCRNSYEPISTQLTIIKDDEC